jgi:hypothetical protein
MLSSALAPGIAGAPDRHRVTVVRRSLRCPLGLQLAVPSLSRRSLGEQLSCVLPGDGSATDVIDNDLDAPAGEIKVQTIDRLGVVELEDRQRDRLDRCLAAPLRPLGGYRKRTRAACIGR